VLIANIGAACPAGGMMVVLSAAPRGIAGREDVKMKRGDVRPSDRELATAARDVHRQDRNDVGLL